MSLVPELAFDLEPTTEDRLFQAEALVRSYCGWHISPSRTETVSLRGRGTGVLTLRSLYVTDVATVTDDGTELTVEDEYVWSEAGVLTAACRWGSGTVVEVTFTHGYDDPPAEVTAVVQAVAQRAVNNGSSLVQETIGPFTNRYAGTGAVLELLDAEKAILNRYRLPSLA